MTAATTPPNAFPAMNAKIVSALQLVLSHYRHDEEKDYESCGRDAANHIFVALKLLSDWLAESKPSKRRGKPVPMPFDDYEIHGVKEFHQAGDKWCEQVADSEADYWSLFGHIPGQGLDCIGDFKTRQHAEEIYARVTGRSYRDAKQS